MKAPLTPCERTKALTVEWLLDEAAQRERKAFKDVSQNDEGNGVLLYLSAATIRKIANRIADGAPFTKETDQ